MPRDQLPRLSADEAVRLRVVDLAARDGQHDRLEVVRVHLVVGGHDARDVDPLLERALVAGEDRRADTAVALAREDRDPRISCGGGVRAPRRAVARGVVDDDDPVDEVGHRCERHGEQLLLVVRRHDDGHSLALDHRDSIRVPSAVVDDDEAAGRRARGLARAAVARGAGVRRLAGPDLGHDEPAPASRRSPVITAAGHAALPSVKYSAPPPQTGPAAADAFGGQTNSNRLPFWPRSATAVAAHVLPAGPELGAGLVDVAPVDPLCPVTARSRTLPASTPLFACRRALALPCWSSSTCAAVNTSLPRAGDLHGAQRLVPASSADVAGPVNVSFHASDVPVRVASKVARALPAPASEAVKPNEPADAWAPPATASTPSPTSASLRTARTVARSAAAGRRRGRRRAPVASADGDDAARAEAAGGLELDQPRVLPRELAAVGRAEREPRRNPFLRRCDRIGPP